MYERACQYLRTNVSRYATTNYVCLSRSKHDPLHPHHALLPDTQSAVIWRELLHIGHLAKLVGGEEVPPFIPVR